MWLGEWSVIGEGGVIGKGGIWIGEVECNW